ncbi:MAG: hypothetical protein ACK55I_26350, partial [bacterium]
MTWGAGYSISPRSRASHGRLLAATVRADHPLRGDRLPVRSGLSGTDAAHRLGARRTRGCWHRRRRG